MAKLIMKPEQLIFIIMATLTSIAFSHFGAFQGGGCCISFNARFASLVCGSDGFTYYHPMCLSCVPGVRMIHYGKCDSRLQIGVASGYGGLYGMSPNTGGFMGGGAAGGMAGGYGRFMYDELNQNQTIV